MSTEPVQAEILGETVEGVLIDTNPAGNFVTGPRTEYVLDVDGSTWRVGEDQIQ